MKMKSGEIIRNLRKELGMSQEVLAEKLSITPHQVSRMERSKTPPDIWYIMQMLELLGRPSEDFWMMYLGTNDYDGYLIYRNLRKSLRDNDGVNARKHLKQLEESAVCEKPFVRQAIAWARVRLNESLSGEEAIEEFYKVLRMSNPSFNEDKLDEQRLYYQEIWTLVSIASRSNKIGDREKAIYITESLLRNRENFKTSEDDKAIILPTLFFNLSNYYGKSDKIKDSLRTAEKGLVVCQENNNFRLIPELMLNIATSHRLMGEEERKYKPYLVRAYHCALGMGRGEIAAFIKKDAEDNFGIKEL